MKKTNYKYSKLKKQLREKKNNGIKFLVWKLTPNTREFIEGTLGYYVEAYIYQINTKSFSNIRFIKNKLIKDLHYMNKRGKQFECRILKKSEKEVLDELGIKYRPIKYKIYLN